MATNGPVRSITRASFLSLGGAAPLLAFLPQRSMVRDAQAGPLTTTTPAAPVFLQRSGQTLSYAGKPFRFTGYNIYEACSDGSAERGCGGDFYDAAALPAALRNLGKPALAGSGRLVRCWFFQHYATDAGVRDWSRFDHAIQVAKAAGYLLIPVLGNHWGDCEGTSAGQSWSDSGGSVCRSPSWYQSRFTSAIEPGLRDSYLAFVIEVVTRYRDENTIAFWQLMNEPACSTAPDGTAGVTVLRRFADTVGSAIRSVDPNHLLSLGSIGSGQPGMANSDYVTVHASPYIDFCEIHDYSNVGNGWYGDQWNGVKTRIAQAQSLGKPLFVGEFGTQTSPGSDQPSNPSTLAARAHLYDQKLTTYFSSPGVVGAIVWDVAVNPTGTTANNDLASTDPAIRFIRSHGAGGAF
jgi:mannan endo-1,4-beta-mannosidase